MKKIVQIFSGVFITNRLGWFFVFLNFSVLYLFFFIFGNGLHSSPPYDCVAGKITITTIYNPHFGNSGQLAKILEMFLLVAVPLNLPGFFLGATLSEFLFRGSPECITISDSEWNYNWTYLIQICLITGGIVTQWLLVGALLNRLGRLVKES